MNAAIRHAKRKDVWSVDFGIEGKVRPCLLLTDYPSADNDLALITVIEHTTSIRGGEWEIEIRKPFLKRPGAFHLQQIQSVKLSRFERRLGALTDAEMRIIETILRRRLGF
jgi:mRNA interferase MazF